MPFYSHSTLESALGLKGQSKSSRQISLDTKEPAYLDKWLFIIEGKDNCWQKYSLELDSKPERPKIIFCNRIYALIKRIEEILA